MPSLGPISRLAPAIPEWSGIGFQEISAIEHITVEQKLGFSPTQEKEHQYCIHISI